MGRTLIMNRFLSLVVMVGRSILSSSSMFRRFLENMLCFIEFGSMLFTSSTVAARNACLSLESMVDLERYLKSDRGRGYGRGLSSKVLSPHFRRHEKFIVESCRFDKEAKS